MMAMTTPAHAHRHAAAVRASRPRPRHPTPHPQNVSVHERRPMLNKLCTMATPSGWLAATRVSCHHAPLEAQLWLWQSPHMHGCRRHDDTVRASPPPRSARGVVTHRSRLVVAVATPAHARRHAAAGRASRPSPSLRNRWRTASRPHLPPTCFSIGMAHASVPERQCMRNSVHIGKGELLTRPHGCL